jgi:hypothetical protein
MAGAGTGLPINTGFRDETEIMIIVSPVLDTFVTVAWNPPAAPVGAFPVAGNGASRWLLPVSEVLETIVRVVVSIVTV